MRKNTKKTPTAEKKAGKISKFSERYFFFFQKARPNGIRVTGTL